jgi:glycosyltransferase involved in cell wall biosynthesis
VAPSDFLYDAYRRNRFYPEKLRKINFGIDLDSVKDYREPKKNRDGIVRFGYVGQIMAHKGVDLLVNAFNRIENGNRRLEIYGPADQDPDYMKSLQKIAGRNGKVAFKNTFPSEELAQRLYDMDVLVIPSRWYENSPLVLLHALATRTPVIVTDVKGMTEFVHNDVNGYTFEMNSVEQLTVVMENIVKDSGRIERLSIAAHYEMDVIDHTDKILELYEEALEGT